MTNFFVCVLQEDVKVRRTLLTPLLQVSLYDSVLVKQRDRVSRRIRGLHVVHTLLGYPLYGQPDVRAAADQEQSVRTTGPYISGGNCGRCNGGDVLETVYPIQTRVARHVRYFTARVCMP